MAAGSRPTKLTRQQIAGFWAAWSGWVLDGMDSVIYALVLAPALAELLPKSGYEANVGNIGFAGSILFALFLIGWGLSFIWGPIADRFGRTRTLAATILVYAVFTGAAAFSQEVWSLALFRLLAGIGVGGEWAMAGTYVAESWPEDRRQRGAGYLQTGYYVGFFIASALNYTVGASYGWRAMFLCGLVPVVVALIIRLRLKEPERWTKTARTEPKTSRLAAIFTGKYRRLTLINAALLTVSIIGLWAGSVYVPTALTALAKQESVTPTQIAKLVSFGTGILSIGTILGCIALPFLAEAWGRKPTLALYFVGMAVSIVAAFGWAFYAPGGLEKFLILLFFLGFWGGNFAVFTLWLPEQYGTSVRATAFAFCTSVGRFIGAGVNFILGGAIKSMGTLGTPVAVTAVAFGIGLLLIPFALETKGKRLPD